MKLYKPEFLIICLFFLGLFLTSQALSKQTYTSTRTDGLIRAGISTNNFRNLEYEKISLFSEGKLELFDKFFNSKICETSPADIIKFEIEKTSFKIYKNNEKIADHVFGPIRVTPLDENPINVAGLKRKGKQAAYRGNFEIIRVPDKKGKLSLVNVLALEEYLKGVVPNELPPSFGMEALKAQAIAARNYAIRPRVKNFPHFDVCDSVQSQVYFGYNTEAPESNEAIENTKGLVALHEGEVILALYSSTAGGYTENFENAFSEPGGGNFPATPLPYLKGKPDDGKTSVLNSDERARRFYTSQPASFDQKSRYYRWTKQWGAEELRNVLNSTLSNYPSCKLISPSVKKGGDIGRIKRIDAVSRGVSGKIIALSVKTSKGEWIIKKELLIRRVFKKDSKALPSANMVFDNVIKDGYLSILRVHGGGFGHGVGMSQYGASYMSKNGYKFNKILQHYYTDIAIGTWPVYMASEYVTSPIKQEFSSPTGKADLIIENPEFIEEFDFTINSYKIALGKKQLEHEKIRVPLDNFVKKGINEIIYYPISETEEKSIKAWVEVFRKAVK